METCDKYLYKLIQINPTMNDFFLKEEFIDKKDVQKNIYSENFYEQLHNLDKEYLKILNHKHQRTFFDEILLRDIKYNIHMETQYEIYMYIPVNHSDNLLIHYVTECNGNGIYQFKTRKDYIHFLCRLS